MTTILFLHDWYSAPGGVKSIYLKDHGYEVINPNLNDEDFDAAATTAQAEFDQHQPQVVVGSSRGGAVAMNINSGDAKLILLCPAWKNWGAAKTVRPSTVILHSRADDVIPFADSEELVRNSGLSDSALIDVGWNQEITDDGPLATMIDLCIVDDEEQSFVTNGRDLSQDLVGFCFTAALRWVGVFENRDWAVVHGTVLSSRAGKRIQHAWCLRDDFVVDFALPVGSRIIERERHIQIMKSEINRAYQSDGALWLSFKNGHDGPWDSEELKG